MTITTEHDQPAISRIALAGVFGGLFCGYLGLSCVIPVLPTFAADRLHAPDVVVGLVITATALTALLVRPVAGALADRHGFRRVMRIGALIVAAGGGLYFLPLSVAGLVGVRLILGVGEAALYTAGAAWTVSLAPHDRRSQLIGLYGVSMWGGISLGTLAGASLLHVSYTAVWWFSVLTPLVGVGLISTVPMARAAVTAGAPGVAPRASTERRSIRGMLLLRPALLPGTALALGAAGYAGLASFVVLLLRARGIGSGVAVLAGYSAVYAGTRLFIGRLPDKLGPRRVAAWSGAGEAIGLLIIALAPDLPVAIIGGLIMGAGFSLLFPSLALMVMNRADKQRQGAALGAYTSFWDLGLAVWGPLTGVVAAGLGLPAVFVTGAACAAAASALALWIDRPAAQPGAGDRGGSSSHASTAAVA